MNVLLDGLTVLKNNWQLTAGILVVVFTCQLLIMSILRSVLGGDLSTSEYISLGIAGWPVPATLLSLIWIPLGLQQISWLGISFLIGLTILLYLRSDSYTASGQHRKPASTSISLIFALAVSISILLRLVYISKTIFPLYFDSAQHYSMINSVMENYASGLRYYHQGFHFLTAFIASAFHVEITQAMLLLGQVFLAFIPFSLFFPVRHETRSDMAGWFAVILSAFGWYMPAHAVDWGKYPALMSVGMIPFVSSLAYLISQTKNQVSTKKQWTLYGLFGISILLSILAHSRSLIVFGIIFLAWVAAVWWQKLPQRYQSFVFIAVVIATVLEIIFIQRQNILTLLFDPYLQKGILVTSLVLLLMVFAWKSYPLLTFTCTLTVTFLLASLFIPVSWIPGYDNLTLLDRPFVEMILFLPLSLVGGLGLAGLQNKLQGSFSWGRYVGLLAMGIVVINAFFVYDLYPSDCCAIVGNDDVAAMAWVENKLPVGARIGISSTELRVVAANVMEGLVGADAGIWITPLTGRVTLPLPYQFEFDQRSALEQLCELDIGYLYVGEVGQTFDNARLSSRPEWYRPLLSMPKARVYEVTGCN